MSSPPKKPGILAVITTLNEDPIHTIASVEAQETYVSKIMVVIGNYELYNKLAIKYSTNNRVNLLYVKPNLGESLGVRLGKAINAALLTAHVGNFDLLLKLDADVVLSSNFLTVNLKSDSDIVGRFGFCMLLKLTTFNKVLGCKWPELTTEDTFIEHLYSSLGYSVVDLTLMPILKRQAGVRYSWRSQFEKGISWYKMGYEPFHAFVGSFIGFRANPRTIYALMGYIYAYVMRTERYSFAPWLFKQQLNQFINPNQLWTRISLNVLPYA